MFFTEGELDEVINPLAVFSFHLHPFEISKLYTYQRQDHPLCPNNKSYTLTFRDLFL